MTDIVWKPDPDFIEATNLAALMREQGIDPTALNAYEQLHAWSVSEPSSFWRRVTEILGIQFDKPFMSVLETFNRVLHPKWFVGGTLNIAKNCFRGSGSATAIITRRHNGVIETWTHDALDKLSNRVANSFIALGLKKGDGVAIVMPMTAEAVAIYLGIIKAGMVVISVPDSVPAEQIGSRLRIGGAKAVFTQSEIVREDKRIPMYERVRAEAAAAPQTIVLAPYGETLSMLLRQGDMDWVTFLKADDTFDAVSCEPDDASNIIFSSGTTGDPKGIPWTHITGIKAASDARFHQDVRAGDVVCWPTNLGWMMGPWVVYGSLMNHAAIALYEGTPGERSFCQFIQDAGVTMLGLVPSIVNGWKNTGHADGLDWSKIRCYSSSGEASNRELYSWLMTLNQPSGDMKPVIEYCGGTEVVAYISSVLLKPIKPAQFNVKTLGVDFEVRDDAGKQVRAGEMGEVFLTAPAIGQSNRLVSKTNHDELYYPNGLTGGRWHGDLMTVLADGSGWVSNGRSGNDLNLNGVKFGSTEIERVVNEAEGVKETAAIGVPPPEGGADRLVIYAVMKPDVAGDVQKLKSQMKTLIKEKLSPNASNVFDVVLINELPRTPSFKVMHKDLRQAYRAKEAA
ncbi:MAG: AMP-dependent synthetase [Alphaproteobacteria bacterium]|nr:AMP-dependent synthetase [Alphaproteobacteria bacterium]